MKKFSDTFVFGVLFVLATGTFLNGVRADETQPPQEPGLQGLNSSLDASPFDIGFYAVNLKNGRVVERQADRSVCLASMVKIFCLTELYRRKVDDGLDLGIEIEVHPHGKLTLEKAASLMIGVSDNPCTHALADFLGRDKVNRIPLLLGIESMGKNILPTEKELHAVLDMRITGLRVASPDLPMHGTARGIAKYYELLLQGKVLSKEISDELLAFYKKHPKAFSPNYNSLYNFSGKGGNIIWTRPPKHFSCMGWGIFGENNTGDTVVLCVWGEWFPQDMSPEGQAAFLKSITDSLIKSLQQEN